MLTDEQCAEFEREFGVWPSTAPGGLQRIHEDLERTVVRNEMADLRHRLNHARLCPNPDTAAIAALEAEITRKELIARVCGRL